MNYIYTYDDNSIITSKIDTIPTDGSNYGILSLDLDLKYHYYIVGSVDKDHMITYYTEKVKPTEFLINKMNSLESTNQSYLDQINSLKSSSAYLLSALTLTQAYLAKKEGVSQ